MDSPPLSARPSMQATALRPFLIPRYPRLWTAAFLGFLSHVRREDTAESATARASGNGIMAAQSSTVSSGVVSLTPRNMRCALPLRCRTTMAFFLLPDVATT